MMVFMDHEKQPLWTINDVAGYLSVSVLTIRSWVYKKTIPYRKVGRHLRFNSSEIEKWTLKKK